MKGYWHFPAISVAICVVVIVFQNKSLIAGFILWLLMLYVFKRLGKIPIMVSLVLFFFFYTFIPVLTPIESPPASETAIYSGTITGSINKTAKKVDFVLQDDSSKAKLLVVYFPDKTDNVIDKHVKDWRHGATCQLHGKLELPDSSTNPGQFDYQRYLLTKGITYQVVLHSPDDISCTGATKMALFYDMRTKLIQYIRHEVSPETAAWLTALVLGDDSSINEDTITLFQRWGLSHILAISGLHVGLIVALVYFMLIKLSILTKEKAQWVMLFFLPLYAIIAGGEPSVWRACVMVMLFIILQKLKLRYSVTDALSIVFLLLIFSDKYIVYHIGFQLSFLVTFGLLLSRRLLLQTESSLYQLLYISFVSQMMIFPLQIAYFYTFHPLSILLNLMVVPYFSFFVIPFMFLMLVLLPISGFFTTVLDTLFSKIHTIFIFVMQAIDHHFYYPLTVGSISITGAILYLVLFFVFMKQLQQKRLWRSFSYGCLITLFIIGTTLKPYFNPAGSVTMLDIGQGDAFIIELPYRKGVVMVDAGAKVNFGDEKLSDKNYRQIIKPYLLSRGISKIDAIFLSHEDVDHVGSVPFMIEDIDVGKVIISEYFPLPDNLRIDWKRNGTELKQLEQGQTITIGNQAFSVVSPVVDRNSANANSLVLYTELGGLSWLFTGDIDADAERNLIAENADLTVDVLKVAHHGSKTSTEQSFLRSIDPTYGLISVGRNNSYGHPAEEVLQRMETAGVFLFRTDSDGAVTFRFKDNQGTFFKYLP
ncbi:DNA internalization-related competence protein ComEC/Rec2 [Virgibacillus dakarensis]|nr:DNA internalization-related competence protein ComEC/Rec2 [Virgibacillus dakarensis]